MMTRRKAEWLTRCRENEQLAERCFVLINQYHEQTGSTEAMSACTSVRAHLKGFKKEYDALKKELPKLKEDKLISVLESSQFQQILDKQVTLLRQMEEGFSTKACLPTDDRIVLLGPATETSPNPWTSGAENRTTEQWGTQELREQHDAIIADQDRGLEQLGKSMRRQRDVALNIGAEADYHSELIDNIGQGVDSTRARVQLADRNIARLEIQTGGTCCLWSIIVLLAILIVVAGAVPKHLIIPV